VAQAELIAHVAGRLTSYKKPREVVSVDRVPRLASGKAPRRVLKDDYLKEHGGRATNS
jgi:long-chain acyl-CoA synthetase